MTLVHRRLDGGRLKNAVKLPGGRRRVEAVLTRTGIFEYKRADGSVQREYRAPDEVFHEDSLATLRGAPVTDLHPPVMVSPDNFSKLTRGHVGDNVRADGDLVVADIVISDADLIRKVDAGERQENSCGYVCDLDMTPGVTPQGERYDAVQRSIRYNHDAVGPKGWGRAGASVALRLDSDGNQLASDDPGDPTPPTNRTDGTMKIRLDHVDYDPAGPEFAQAFAQYKDRVDGELEKLAQVQTDLSAAQGRADAAEEKAKDLQGKLDAAISPAELDKRVAERADMLATAGKFLPESEKLDGLTDDEIRRKVVEHNRKALKLDDKDASYIAAAYEVIVSEEPTQRVDHTSNLRAAIAGKGPRRVIRADRITVPAKG